MKDISRSRDATVDVLRGLAIVTMIAANLAGPVLVEPHPTWIRLYGSFAAPIFVLLSGMMVGLTAAASDRRPTYYLARGASLLTVAALVDIGVWQIFPFTTVDVLYLIGVCVPMCALLLRLSEAVRWTIVALVFVATPLLQSSLGYTPYPTEIFLTGAPTIVVSGQTTILNHWLVDGFFPLFPWAGFALLGACLASRRWREGVTVRIGRGWVVALSVALFVAGALIWSSRPGVTLTRAGYSELFYPPTVGYVITALGVIGVLFRLVDRRASARGFDVVCALGESALAMYVLHLLVIRYAIKTLWPARIELPGFVVLYVGLSALLVVTAFGLRALKRHWRPRVLLLNVVLGR